MIWIGSTCARTVPSCMRRVFMPASLGFMFAGCATAPLERAGSLSSYEHLKSNNGVITKSQVYSDRETLLKARTVRLVPITFSERASAVGLTPAEQDLVANATSRSLCNTLSRKFKIVPEGEAADLTVKGTITYVAVTDSGASAASQAASVAGSILIPIPVPVPRLPIGMGGLAVEAEAHDANGRQVAALVWARGADAFSSKARVAKSGDAYDLTSNFSDDFSQLLKNGTSDNMPTTLSETLPSWDDIVDAVDGKPKATACAAYGHGPGFIGAVGANFGTPPDWTDKGGRPTSTGN